MNLFGLLQYSMPAIIDIGKYLESNIYINIYIYIHIDDIHA